MAKSTKKKRARFKVLKKKQKTYDQFNGKDSTKDIHHQLPLGNGGQNNNENLVYVDRWWHKLLHSVFLLEATKITEKVPTTEYMADYIADKEIDKTRDGFKEDVKKHIKFRKKSTMEIEREKKQKIQQDIINDMKNRKRR